MTNHKRGFIVYYVWFSIWSQFNKTNRVKSPKTAISCVSQWAFLHIVWDSGLCSVNLLRINYIIFWQTIFSVFSTSVEVKGRGFSAMQSIKSELCIRHWIEMKTLLQKLFWWNVLIAIQRIPSKNWNIFTEIVLQRIIILILSAHLRNSFKLHIDFS